MCLLARRDRSGYELSLFTAPPRNFLLWSAGHSQIYPELAKLTEAGLVDFSRVSQPRRPDKKVYRLTEPGLDALRRWVLEPPRRTPVRQELMMKSHGCWLADPAGAAALFRSEAEIAETEIGMIEQHRERLAAQYDIPSQPGAGHPLFGTWANIRYAISSRRTLAEWCRWVEGELRKASGSEAEEETAPDPVSPPSPAAAVRPPVPRSARGKPRARAAPSRRSSS
jgi:DNA-binding PadR family transcriptional regulator